MTESERRVMRLAMPVNLIRAMDAAILQGLGGYETRAEFILDAIQERLVDLTVPKEIDAGVPDQIERWNDEADRATGDASEYSAPMTSLFGAGLEATRLSPPSAGFVLQDPEGRNGGGPLFGLHNRDYPSLWALGQIARAANEGPVGAEDLFAQLVGDAWEYGAVLGGLEAALALRLSGLFPTNREKRKSAEAAFRSFAVGDFRVEGESRLTTAGPLFEWAAAGLVRERGDLLIGVTEPGWALLGATAGITAAGPHPAPQASAFFDHILRFAPDDAAGFQVLLEAVGQDGASRTAVLDRFQTTWRDWTQNEVSTNAAGYVARAREWGLVREKQAAGRYQLTPFGLERLEQTTEE